MDNKLVFEVERLLNEVKNKKPLVHNITNYVTVNDCANILLALGASPIMADDVKEAADITKISSALVINIGTLNERTIESMILAGRKANELNIPVVFDPVGAGASEFRNATTKKILEEIKISVLRGNMSEVKFISGLKSTTKGVDASENDVKTCNDQGIKVARNLANKLNCTVAITGVTDIVSDGERVAILKNGTKMLSNVTGTGCMTSALVGGFCGAGSDYFIAAISGIISMGIAGEIAFEKAGKIGTGSFHIAIIDAISNLDSETIRNMIKIK
ncbi:hydroxyethylthiazole kinase [Clostridium saccharobutylicum]|uniref:Hydroxyethylthiazole kinase n=1 Tax=Clostridium saccharobutylicum DSM 13864 TaxID=1345695 RepID=U5MMC8_CLOSA|nr:hydroxyethylthiazole kinase [Clostridium saccharobutylicum]AGX41750.1 hydroxyethylthiazole kinase ThiM [Clostridium saccharobutylicum DSM 13864]AQR89029.1 hydroxyethylthiazole kinase [Clostridium saccharobutylicum]AQR98930.1 hydroxyethylthiazole kinase [Clostridium saccharobutylicum]AQS08649.1 hydroxyethylthiazole kinase [Clostridium saccharobutylicum]AQS12918.1 hydroxyethylthiazole kinase [Clostridium saccharobutylicum]